MDTLVQTTSLCDSKALIERLGGDPEAIAVEAGVPFLALHTKETPVSAFSVGKFFEIAAIRCNCDNLGILIGEDRGWESLGEIWQIMDRCETVGAILQALERSLLSRDNAVFAHLHTADDLVTIHFDMRSGIGPTITSQIVEQGIAMGVTGLRKIIGKGWSPVLVQFRHGQPADLRDFERVLGPNVQFDQDRNAIVIDRSCMNIRRHSKAVEAKRLAQDTNATTQIPGRDVSLGEIEDTVRHLISNGECSLTNLAKIYDVSERQMQRQLSSQNDGYRSVLARVRRDLCIKYLVCSNLNIAQIADLLQFSETSCLTRFVKNECRATPQRIRNNPEVLGPGLFTPKIRQLRTK